MKTRSMSGAFWPDRRSGCSPPRSGRLYSSTYYALRDTRTPLALRGRPHVALDDRARAMCSPFRFRRWLGVPALWGAAGLTASAGIAGWAEMLLLRRTLNRRIGHTGLPSGYLARLWIAAGSAAGAAWALKVVMPPLHPVLTALVVLTPYGAVFLACTLRPWSSRGVECRQADPAQTMSG